ncbi:hypothetical protein GA0074695_0706 [Micromonospora viridifaciens]|uniref:Uncharacterized protein n=1 Tax=Micromonospora viridifaciens TaxID=1881 RepID=A0A1C4UPJ6_MICVI|nr:hypothetical protein [Micromonospora viridifaciens]SCE73629.1 hypothetical protein GA0074695_0706 [Micromonospora viridifaciens]
MPAPVAPAEKRNSSLLTVLFWVGVALAPLAALILLVADGGGLLRIGAVLAILAVVLIGLSIALRGDGGAGAAGVEELRDEVEQLRHELRNEIVAAAQRGNQALDQAQRAQETVTALGRRLDAAAAGIAAAAAGITTPAAEEPAGGRARVPAAEAYDEGRLRHGAAPEQASTGEGQPAGWGEDGSPRRPQPGVYGAPRPAEPEGRPESRPVGVVHHTETVHVTTRHTIVDGGADPGAGARYGGYAGRWSPEPEERPGSGGEPEDRPRTGYRNAADDPGWTAGRAGDDPGWTAGRAGDGPGWSAGRAGDGPGWSAGRAGDDRSWNAGRADGESWSTRPADQRSRSVASDGSADPRSWSGPREGAAGRDGWRDDRSWSPGPDRSRDEGSWAARHDGRDRNDEGWGSRHDGRDRNDEGWGSRHDGRDRNDEGWGSRPEGRDRSDEGWGAPDVPARADSARRAPGADDPDGDYWSEMRAGNRWASVRDDERGREIRVGERRAAVHAADGGTEYRVEDRWASVREPRRDHGAPVAAGWAEEESRPALPAGGVPVPDEWRPPRQRSGRPEWHRAEPEPVRYGDERYDGPPHDEAPRPRAGGTRPADRWR